MKSRDVTIGLALVALVLLASSGGSSGARVRRWPVVPYRGILSPFGAHRTRADGSERLHAGVDLGALPGDAIVAIDDGRVLYPVSGFSLKAGLQAFAVQFPDAQYIYAEVSGVRVKPGDVVRAGDVLCTVARNNDGNSMLHLEAWTVAPHAFTEWTPTYRPPGLLDVQSMLPKVAKA